MLKNISTSFEKYLDKIFQMSSRMHTGHNKKFKVKNQQLKCIKL